MLLDNAKQLKELAVKQITENLIIPYGSDPYSPKYYLPPAVGLHSTGKGNYQLAVHLAHSSHRFLIERVEELAKGEVNIRVTGPAYFQSSKREQHYTRPLRIGVSISHYDPLAGTGTLGCFVRKRGQSDLLILSNNHILANYNSAKNGDIIIQPARQDDGHPENDRIAELKHFVTLLSGEEKNYVDAAVALVKEPEKIDNISCLKGFVNLQGFRTQEELEELVDFTVAKIGRSSGLTTGTVSDFEMEISMLYRNEVIRFDGLIAIASLDDKPFSEPGDSGSVIVDDQGYAIAMLVGGTKGGITYATPIDTVLNTLDVDLALN
ncbi:MAG: hypothetical protein VKL59_01115 [Nostocaceae cyanobacterium]|nr:hypothetical protein [Nostocaceae cyanobacterium]